jgi:hypothetical protein
MNGFRNETSKGFILEKNRLVNAIKMISQENPDILVLNEAGFWPCAKEDKINSWSKVLKKIFDDSYLPTDKLFRWAPIIISRFPIISWKDSSKGWGKNGISAKILLGKTELILHAVHPHPDLTDTERGDYVASLIEVKGRNQLICGDLNSLSFNDVYNKSVLLNEFKKFKKNGDDYIDDLLKFSATKKLNDLNLVDTFKEKNKTFDFTIPTDFLSKNKSSGIRIDYIFCSKDFNVLKSGIIKNKFSELASDHYPIFAKLELK